jgi:hypothetical protein
MQIETRYGKVYLTHHASDRWVERTGRSLEELVAAIRCSVRPTKQQLNRINKRTRGKELKRVLECDVAYFILCKQVIVTVYQKGKHMQNELQRSFTTPHTYGALEREIEMAEALVESQGTAFPDGTLEEGFIAGIKFVLCREGSCIRDAYEEMMDGKDTEGEAA